MCLLCIINLWNLMFPSFFCDMNVMFFAFGSDLISVTKVPFIFLYIHFPFSCIPHSISSNYFLFNFFFCLFFLVFVRIYFLSLSVFFLFSFTFSFPLSQFSFFFTSLHLSLSLISLTLSSLFVPSLSFSLPTGHAGVWRWGRQQSVEHRHP